MKIRKITTRELLRSFSSVINGEMPVAVTRHGEIVVMLSKPQQIQNTLEKFEARLAAHDDLLDRITDRVFPEEL